MFPSSSGKVFAAKQSEQKKSDVGIIKTKGRSGERRNLSGSHGNSKHSRKCGKVGGERGGNSNAAADLEEGWRGGRGSVARFGTSALLFSGNEVVFL